MGFLGKAWGVEAGFTVSEGFASDCPDLWEPEQRSMLPKTTKPKRISCHPKFVGETIITR